MSYTVSWTGPNGPVRKKASTPAEALRWWMTYNKVSLNFIIKDEAGKRVSADSLMKMMEP